MLFKILRKRSNKPKSKQIPLTPDSQTSFKHEVRDFANVSFLCKSETVNDPLNQEPSKNGEDSVVKNQRHQHAARSSCKTSFTDEYYNNAHQETQRKRKQNGVIDCLAPYPEIKLVNS